MTFEEEAEFISLPDAIRRAAEGGEVIWIHDALGRYDHEDDAECPCRPVRVCVLDIEHTQVIWSRT